MPFDRALVLSAGGLWAAWQVGAWSALSARYQPDLIVGASAGAWNGWVLASGASPDELACEWRTDTLAGIFRVRLQRTGFLDPRPLHDTARELFDRYRPRTPFALTIVEVPSLRSHIVRDHDITWKHLAASCAIPFAFPPIEIEGRYYVDGGFRAGLPLWAAEELGARRALALNVLNTPFFRLLHRTVRGKRPSRAFDVTRVEPSQPLGTLRSAMAWNATNIERWMELGRRDASSVKI